jgi:hypothetical protein
MTDTQTITKNAEEITRTQAARLLGVSVSSVRGYPIPFRQYKPRSKAMYVKSDVLAFQEASKRVPA